MKSKQALTLAIMLIIGFSIGYYVSQSKLAPTGQQGAVIKTNTATIPGATDPKALYISKVFSSIKFNAKEWSSKTATVLSPENIKKTILAAGFTQVDVTTTSDWIIWDCMGGLYLYANGGWWYYTPNYVSGGGYWTQTAGRPYGYCVVWDVSIV